MAIKGIVCAACGQIAPKRGASQKYCEPCSAARDLQRKKLWARGHPPGEEAAARKAVASSRRQELARQAGAIASRGQAETIAWDASTPPALAWMVRVAIPFSYAASKNHIYAMRAKGHVALRRESTAIRDELALALRRAVEGKPIVCNKVWVDIYAQKPNHKGDAINVIDLVCDAIKRAIPVDDRWYCIRRLDWQIVKEKPRLFVGIGQEEVEDSQVCSYCGDIKLAGAFGKKSGNLRGIDRVCRECRHAGRELAREQA